MSHLRVIRMRFMPDRVGVCRSMIYEFLNERSPRYDPSFPRPIKLGAHCVGWIESEVEEWIRVRMSQRTEAAH
ncbi:MAG: AlpA family phage regulatory protein [Xanthomonadaceae bacterium]|jgi:prophage regulatory protein|nr:AlpA family phage regulatory protein [Xanthomonadaceae bacterium]